MLPQQQSWLALHLACMTWPALSTQVGHCLAMLDVVSAAQQGIAPLLTMIAGLEEKLVTIQKSRTFAYEVEQLSASATQLITMFEPAYPQALRWIPQPPLVLYVRGQLLPDDGLAIAVVGSRQPSSYGKTVAQQLSTALVQHGFTVISGLARGIDGLAHQGALAGGGRTIAVLGCGINRIYPPEHRALYERVCEQGAVISEFPWDTKPDRWNFPRRNRIISGLALGTLVVEASDRSGSLSTARHAVEQGREVFAVPGRIDQPHSRGTHSLIKRGAKLVESIEDILEELSETWHGAPSPAEPLQVSSQPQDLSPEEAQLLALIPQEETHIDTVIHASQLPAHAVASILVTLELRGLVRQAPGKFFSRS